MKPRPHGNGSGKIDIHQQDMGGWLRVFTDETQAQPDDLATFLSLALTDWFRQRPHLRLRSVTDIVREGRSVELHCWYDMHLFPNVAHEPVPPK